MKLLESLYTEIANQTNIDNRAMHILEILKGLMPKGPSMMDFVDAETHEVIIPTGTVMNEDLLADLAIRWANGREWVLSCEKEREAAEYISQKFKDVLAFI